MARMAQRESITVVGSRTIGFRCAPGSYLGNWRVGRKNVTIKLSRPKGREIHHAKNHSLFVDSDPDVSDLLLRRLMGSVDCFTGHITSYITNRTADGAAGADGNVFQQRTRDSRQASALGHTRGTGESGSADDAAAVFPADESTAGSRAKCADV